MCGICGYAGSPRGPFDPSFIGAMTRSLTHRGPDGHGFHVDPDHAVALGHTRLKVIDLTENGRQPMCDDTGRIWITYNGEVYNFRELRKDLEARGCRFRSATDTEVVVYAYREYGEDFIHRLNGDFAFALWDERIRKLFLYRDRAGIRPLYYAFYKETLFFASEIKAIFEHPDAPAPEINGPRIPEYFGHLYIYGEETLYRNIFEVQPGACITFHQGTIAAGRYHEFTFDRSVRNLPLDEQVEGFKELFDDAIRIRLVSDVPLGIYLSGGIDSSYLTARLGEFAAGTVNTYSLGFDYEDFNEFPYSDVVAGKIGTTHTKFLISEHDFNTVIDDIIRHYDEPPPQIVSVPQYYLAREAKKHLTVALSGSGGDELFAGYTHYLAAWRLYRENQGQNGTGRGGADAVSAYQRGLSPALIAAEFKSCSQKHLVDRFFADDIPDYRQNIARYWEENDYPDFISKMLSMDFKTHVVAMMNKDDKMNMAWGIEGRFPYLDYRVIQFALSMSPELKIRGDVGKWVLKDLCRQYFDDGFIHREKQAFPTPAEHWLKGRDLNPAVSALLEAVPGTPFDEKNLRALLFSPRDLCDTGVPARRMWGVYCLYRWVEMMRRGDLALRPHAAQPPVEALP